jgi:hypothetical protein
VKLQRAEFLRSIGRRDVARRIETPRNREPVTIEQQIAAVALEIELAADADQRRIWRAVAKTLRGVARAARDGAASTGRET